MPQGRNRKTFCTWWIHRLYDAKKCRKLQPLIAEIEAEGGLAYGFASDARKEEQVITLVEEIEANIGEIDVLVFNIGANVPCSILEETARKYFKIWEMACFGAF